MDFSLSIQVLSVVAVVLVASWAYYYFFYLNQEKAQAQNKPYVLGLKYMAEKDYRRAIEKFKEAVREDSDNIDAYLKLGDILRKEGLAQNAARIHRDLSLRSGIDPLEANKITYSLALDYWHTAKPEKAEVYFKKLLTDDEFKLLVIPYLLSIYENTKQYKQAVELIQQHKLTKFEKYQIKLVLLKIMDASDIQNSGDGKQARIQWKETLKIKPDCVLSILRIGESYIQEERLDDALNIWTEFCQKYPEKAWALYPALEKTYFEQGNFAQIQALYEKILKDAPQSAQTYQALSSILRKKGDLDAALSLINEGLERGADEELLNDEIFRILHEKGKFKEAADKANELLRNQFSAKKQPFVCKKCQYMAAEPFILCPECGSIDSPF